MNTTELKIRHVLADGREVDSVEGLIIPPTGPTAEAYRIVAEFLKNRQKTTYQEEQLCARN